jgi:hypothetical protein
LAFPTHIHDPNAVLDYPIDLSDFAAKGDPAVAVTATADDGATIENVFPLNAEGIAAARVTGADMTLGESYTLTFHYTLQSGQEDDRSETLKCRQR